MQRVIKRDGRRTAYDRNKIVSAIQKANDEVETSEKISEDKIYNILASIENRGNEEMAVEEIQDIIEQKLMAEKKFVLAKTYIIYRYNRELVRKANTTDDSILALIGNSNKDVMEENSNKNAVIASTQRDLIAGEVSRDLTKRLLLPEKISKAHDQGVLHLHVSLLLPQKVIPKSTTSATSSRRITPQRPPAVEWPLSSVATAPTSGVMASSWGS